ncbi:MAG: hypothetical protein HY583_00875 [Candidatus Omnitrophica bacterium]|nr:hypothetical protein [Candidatus Omnitrophota bacterium]
MRISKQIVGVAALFLCCLFSQSAKATFFGEVKTGLQNVADDKYGYSLFVPTDYTRERHWPLVMALHNSGDRGENYMQTWTEAAKKYGVIIFCPTYEEPRGGVPFDHDNRLIQLKREIQNQYEIDPNRVLITGFGGGGHYAFYLGLRYPKEFSAIASIGDATKGSLKKLFTFSYAEVNQLPILILVDEKSEIVASPESTDELKRLRSQGYLVETVEAKNSSDLKNPNTNSYLLEWFQQVSAERETGFQRRSFSIKQEFYEWVDNLLQNR